jgi:hypothetical protein
MVGLGSDTGGAEQQRSVADGRQDAGARRPWLESGIGLPKELCYYTGVYVLGIELLG